MSGEKPHIAILGAGPIGLEAALAAAEAGYPFTLFESAPRVAAQVDGWRHVRLFTPWELDVSPRMRRSLAAVGKEVPDNDDCPTGGDLVDQVFDPIAALPQVRDNLSLASHVRGVGRQGLLKHEEISTSMRAAQPFRLLVENGDGKERLETADIILDCTGNPIPNSLGDGGIPAPGESALNGAVGHQVPNLLQDLETWKGQRILLVGAGHSAQTAALDLAELVGEGTETKVTWAVRSSNPTWGIVEDDVLPARARLTRAAAQLAEQPPSGFEVVTGVVVDQVFVDNSVEKGVDVTLRHRDGKNRTLTVDRILSLTGHVGEHMLYRQLQVHECYATSGPMKLAAALMGAEGGDCMTQAAHGADTLRNPEPGYFILGSKSYGRRNDFLMRVGWQQVDEVFELLAES